MRQTQRSPEGPRLFKSNTSDGSLTRLTSLPGLLQQCIQLFTVSEPREAREVYWQADSLPLSHQASCHRAPNHPKTPKEMVLSAVRIGSQLPSYLPTSPPTMAPLVLPLAPLYGFPSYRSCQTLSLVSLPPWTPLSAANLSMVLLLPPSFIRSSSKV